MNIFEMYATFLHLKLLGVLEVTSSDLLVSLLLGESLDWHSAQVVKIKTTGMLYFFVISGMHLSLLHRTVQQLMQRLCHKTHVSSVVAFCVMTLYAMVIGWSVPIIRTCVMKFYSTVGSFFGRLLSARLVLVWLVGVYGVFSYLQKEWLVASPSFLLSYGAVFALLRTQQRNNPPSLLAYVVASLQTSIRVNIVIAPLLLYFFGEWNPVSLVYSVVFAPLISVLVGLGFVFLAWVSLSELLFSSFRGVSTIFVPLFSVLIRSFEYLLEIAVRTSIVFSYQPSLFALLGYYLLVFLVFPSIKKWSTHAFQTSFV